VLAAWGRRRARADADELRALRVAHAAATGPVATTAMRRLAIDRVEPRNGPTGTGTKGVGTKGTGPTGKGARTDGVGVHVMPRIGGDDRGALHRLAHYLVRAPVALGRFDRAGPDRVVHRLTRPFADGTTHVEFSSDELARRLVGLASAEPVHRVGYHGALARGALVKWRAHALQLALVEADPTLPTGRRVRARPSTWPAASCTRCGGPLAVVSLEESSEPRVIQKVAAAR
jgi:hypothetical protein